MRPRYQRINCSTQFRRTRGRGATTASPSGRDSPVLRAICPAVKGASPIRVTYLGLWDGRQGARDRTDGAEVALYRDLPNATRIRHAVSIDQRRRPSRYAVTTRVPKRLRRSGSPEYTPMSVVRIPASRACPPLRSNGSWMERSRRASVSTRRDTATHSPNWPLRSTGQKRIGTTRFGRFLFRAVADTRRCGSSFQCSAADERDAELPADFTVQSLLGRPSGLSPLSFLLAR